MRTCMQRNQGRGGGGGGEGEEGEGEKGLHHGWDLKVWRPSYFAKIWIIIWDLLGGAFSKSSTHHCSNSHHLLL